MYFSKTEQNGDPDWGSLVKTAISCCNNDELHL